MDINDIRKSIYALKKTTFGYSIPEIRKLAKKGARAGYIKFMGQVKNDDYWLKIYFAFLIGYMNDDINNLLHYFKKFIPLVNDWAVNDSLCQNFRHAKRYQNEVWSMLMEYKTSKKEFEVRIITVMLLSHFLNDNYIDKVINVINELYLDSYYSKMGVAWAVATIAAKYPQKGMDYLKSENNKLDKWTYNKSLQKIRESYRVSNEIKELTKGMKR